MLHTSISKSRSGMVLLIVMTLLAMMSLTAVTFILTAGQLKESTTRNITKGTSASVTSTTTKKDVVLLLDDGIMTVIRGSNDSNCAVYGNSILEDMYGTGSNGAPIGKFTGTLGFDNENGMITITGGSIQYAGCVVTCIDKNSPAYKRSTVVLKYQNGTLYCLPFDDGATYSGSAEFMVNTLPYQQENHDYDAFDDNNYFLANRTLDAITEADLQKRCKYFSFRNASSPFSTFIDADRDGYSDSKWLDFGMPVFAIGGKRFRPLYAVVIEDMDGKLNVNAAGNWPELTASTEYGMGRGPAEIAWERTLGVELAKKLYIARMSVGRKNWTSLTQNANNTDSADKADYTAYFKEMKGPWYRDYTPFKFGQKDTTEFYRLNTYKDEARLKHYVLRIPHDIFGLWSYSIDSETGEPVFEKRSFSNLQWDFGFDESEFENYIYRNPTLRSQYDSLTDAKMPAVNSYLQNVFGNTYDRDLGSASSTGVCYDGTTDINIKETTDMAFSPQEIEAMFRLYDFDTPFLPKRLRKIVAETNGYTNSQGEDDTKSIREFICKITTESWDLPISKKLSVSKEEFEKGLPETVAGWQIDLLRAASFTLKDDDWDSTSQTFPKRQKFMQAVYSVLKDQNLDPGGSGSDLSTRQAQWAANLVDYLDVDNIMTPFKPLGADFTVFGCEQPSLLITDTFAMHSRNSEPNAVIKNDLQVGGYGFDENGKAVKGPQSETDDEVYEYYGGSFSKEKFPVLDENGKVQTDENGKTLLVTDETETKIKNKLAKLKENKIEGDSEGTIDWDQYLRPQGALFVQIYNPKHYEASNAAYSDYPKTMQIDHDIYEEKSWTIDLAKLAGEDSENSQSAEKNPIWRMVITDDIEPLNEENNLHRDTATWPQKGGEGDCFTQHIKMVVSFRAEDDGSFNVKPDLEKCTEIKENEDYFTFYPESSRIIEEGQTVLIGPSNETVFEFDSDKNADEDAATLVKQSVTLSGTQFTSKGNLGSGEAIAIKPLAPNSAKFFARFSLTEPRTEDFYEENENADYYGPDTALQLDTNLLSLLSAETAFEVPLDTNWGILTENKNDAKTKLKEYGTSTSNRCLVHLQRLADPNRQWDNETNPYITVDSMIVDLTVMNARIKPMDIEKDQNGSVLVQGTTPANLYSQQRDKNAYLWEQLGKLSEEVSTKSLKFGNIPNGTPTWLGWLNCTPESPFQVMNVTNRCSSELMYHYQGEGTGTGLANTYGYLPDFSGDFRKAVAFFRVPSPQTVTPMVLNKTNFENAESEDIPGAYYTMYREPGRININTAPDEVWLALLNSDSFSGSSTQTTFRSILQSPGNSVLSSSTFPRTSARQVSKLDPANTRLNSYRYANLATVRSNVFAVWLTMGLFEVDEEDKFIKDGNGNAIELGEDTGEKKRYRAFYMIDRTIPVGFERGKNHNADKVIILKRMLQ